MRAAKIACVPEQRREICIWAVCVSTALLAETLRWCEEGSGGCSDEAVCSEPVLTEHGLPECPACLGPARWHPFLPGCASETSLRCGAGVGRAGRVRRQRLLLSLQPCSSPGTAAAKAPVGNLPRGVCSGACSQAGALPGHSAHLLPPRGAPVLAARPLGAAAGARGGATHPACQGEQLLSLPQPDSVLLSLFFPTGVRTGRADSSC